MKALVNYAEAFDLEYSVSFIDARMKDIFEHTLLCVVWKSVNQYSSALWAIYTAWQAVYRWWSLSPFAQESEHESQDGEDSGHTACWLLDSL